MRSKILAIVFVCISGLAFSCQAESKTDSWPYSEAYRGLTPLSEEQAKERAIRKCEKELGTTNGVIISILPSRDEPDYFHIVVKGELRGNSVSNSVMIHRFNAKGDKIEKPASKPGAAATRLRVTTPASGLRLAAPMQPV